MDRHLRREGPAPQDAELALIMKNYRTYIWAFLITLVIFVAVTAVSSYFDNRRVDEISSIEDGIARNILSSETQFDLLRETPCENIDDSDLSSQLDSLGERVSYLENSRGTDDPQVMNLKQDYSLLEIKDYILMNTMAQKCKTAPSFIFYFYSNAGDCPDCRNAGAALTALRQEYPEVRVYSFDYHSPAAAVQTLANIYKVKAQFPAYVIHSKPVYGLKSLDDIEKLMPELAAMTASSTAATSTASTTKK